MSSNYPMRLERGRGARGIGMRVLGGAGKEGEDPGAIIYINIGLQSMDYNMLDDTVAADPIPIPKWIAGRSNHSAPTSKCQGIITRTKYFV